MATKVLMQNPLASSRDCQKDPLTSHSFGRHRVAIRRKGEVRTTKAQSLTTTSLVSSPTIVTPAIDSNLNVKIDRETGVLPPAEARRASGPASSLASCWREIQGCNNWEDLIEPLEPMLRREIARYGDLVIATYKAFDLDPNSKRYLNCKYGKKSLLREVGVEDSGYEVTKYVYATPDVPIISNEEANRGRWIGYVAVGSDDSVKKLGRRDIVVTFRGTVTNPEWIANFMSSLAPARLDPHDARPEVKVESGFLSLYTSDENKTKFGLGSCREQLLSEISRLLKKYKDEEVSITLAGHSMGSSLALLLGYDIAELGLNQRPDGREAVPVTVFSYAGPRVGNFWFKKRCEELGVKVLRITNVNDPITKLPGVVFNENLRVLGGRLNNTTWSCSCYAHVGVELSLDFFDVQNPSSVHDLESYLNLLRCDSRKRLAKEVPDRRDDIILNNHIDAFLSKAKEVFSDPTPSLKALPLRSAAYSFVNVVGSVSDQMLSLGIF